MTKTMHIDDRAVGPGERAFLVAEIAQNHDGSLGTAHAYVDAVADAGADAIKFQVHMARYESTLDEPFRVKFSKQDATRYAYWERMEFADEEWRGLVERARERGLAFICSTFSVPAVEMMSQIGMSCWKLAAGEFRSMELLDAMASDGKAVILSSGMSTWSEMVDLAARMSSGSVPHAMLQCTSRYPVSLEEVGLNVMAEMRERFDCPVGLSDHSGTVHPGLAAMAKGADILEVHVVADRRLFGPDVRASVTLDELRVLAEARDAFAVMERNPVDKDRMAESLSEMRSMFGKSVAPRDRLPAGTVLAADMLMPKKPGSGVPYGQRDKLIGRRLVRDVVPERLLRREDVEGCSDES